MRMDTAARLKMDYDSLKARLPNLIYIHAAGFGADGPYAGRPPMTT